MLRRWLFPLVWLTALVALVSVAQAAHAQAPARKGASITVNPASGAAGTQVQVTGSNYPFFCAGYILIDGSNTGTQFQCGATNSFQVTFTWPDRLPDGHHTVTARTALADASTGFVQATPIQPTMTPAPSVTPEPSATAGTGGSTTTPPDQHSGPYTSNLPAVLAFGGLCCSVLVLAIGVVTLFLTLRRRDARQAVAYSDAGYAPPPPPPPDAPLNPDDPWIWPRDPYAR